jgi:hypothetical protein
VNPDVQTDIRAYRTPEWGRQAISLFITTTQYDIKEGEVAQVIPNGSGFARAPRAVRFETEEILPAGRILCAARLSEAEAQLLMDSLWEAGIRPAAGAGSVGQLGAVERHLSDMRAIAFGQLQLPSKT